MSKLFYGDIGFEPPLNPPEEEEQEPVGHCAGCGEPIYVGDIWYDIYDDMICEECISAARRRA